jgi:hypothetical protein
MTLHPELKIRENIVQSAVLRQAKYFWSSNGCLSRLITVAPSLQ